MKFNFDTLVTILLIVAAINWGLVAYNGTDLVDKLTPQNPTADRYIKLAIGLAGLYAGYKFVSKKMLKQDQ